MSETKTLRVFTSYLAHPLWRVKREGVLRVPVCRRLRWYADRKDAYWRELVPSLEAVTAGKGGNFTPYLRELEESQYNLRGWFSVFKKIYPLVVLLCWEGDPLTCHRRFAKEVVTGQLWTLADEVKGHYGGLAEVGGELGMELGNY